MVKKRFGVLRRLLAVVVVAACVVICKSVYAKAWTQRSTPPESNNAWYYSSTNPYYAATGLAPKGIKEGGSYVIGNCTWYAWGRAAEVLGSAPKIGSGNPYAMWTYVNNNHTYETGSTPRAGSLVIGRSGSSYHVAFVEYVKDGVAYVSESGYKESNTWPGFDGIYFHTGPVTAWMNGGIIGYIYLTGGSSNDKTPPSVSDLHVWEITDKKFTVSANVTDANGISSVRYAVWTTNNDQDDLVWYDAVYETTGKFYWIYVPYSDHKNEKGTYVIDIYAYDSAGNLTTSRITYNFESGKPTISDFHVWQVTDTKFTVSAYVTAANGVSSVRYAVWTTKNDQDDLVWYDAIYETTGKFYWTYVPYSDHKNENGTYVIDIYAYDKAGILTSSRILYTLNADISNATITTSSQTYTGSAITPKPVVKLNDKTLAEGTDYSLSYSNNTAVGTATVTVTGKGSYTGSKSITFQIVAANLSSTSISSIASQTYTGSAIKPKPTLTFNGKTLVEGTDYTLSYSNNTAVGTATVTATGKGNFTGTKSATFQIIHASGWVYENGGYYYYETNGTVRKSSWIQSGGVWYYLGWDGKLVTNGWATSGGKYYYMGSNGQAKTYSWIPYNGKYYYAGSDGALVFNNWVYSGGNYYYMDAAGNPVLDNWVKYNGTWYHFSASGVCDYVYNAA